MGARYELPPDGYDVVKSRLFGGYVVLVAVFDDNGKVIRDRKGRPMSGSYLVDAEEPHAVRVYAKRAKAVADAKFHQLLTENARLRAANHRAMIGTATDTRLAVGVS